jgi:hypothetical protein
MHAAYTQPNATKCNQTNARRDFWADFRKKIGALAVAGLVILTTLANPVSHEKAPQGV